MQFPIATIFGLLAATVTLTSISVRANAIPSEVARVQAQAPNLTLIGELGNKRFYSAPEIFTWHIGENYCELNGMTLVAIETREEHTYLGQILQESDQYYWTAGIESFIKYSNYFEWTNTGKRIQNYKTFQALLSAVAFHPVGGFWEITMRVYPTTTEFPIICQQFISPPPATAAGGGSVMSVRKLDPKDAIEVARQ